MKTFSYSSEEKDDLGNTLGFTLTSIPRRELCIKNLKKIRVKDKMEKPKRLLKVFCSSCLFLIFSSKKNTHSKDISKLKDEDCLC